MSSRSTGVVVLVSVMALSACAQPIGPTVQVLPPPGKPFAAFQDDQRVCSIYTGQQLQPLINQAASAQVGTAVLGTILGAGLGAAIGGGRGAAIGAGAGALGGTGVGASAAAGSQDRLQVTYDNTYAACMVSRGDQVAQAPTFVVQPSPILVQPAPYYVQPQPYYVPPPGTYIPGRYRQ